MILTSRKQPTWLLGKLTSLGSSQPPQLAGLAFENGLCAHAPLRLARLVARPCYIKVGTGAWVQQEHTSWRAGQPHNYLYPTPNKLSQLTAELQHFLWSTPCKGSLCTVRWGLPCSLLNPD